MMPPHLQKLEEGCLQCLSYFGIFKYPLTAIEIGQFNPYRATKEEIDIVLHELMFQGKVFHIEGYYMLENKEEWLQERLAGNKRALEILGGAYRYISNIAAFPFVRGIAISGSLSKFYAEEEADIDYFIITEKNRLWISRSFLHFFKKLSFIIGHQHYYCMNFFIDTEALAIMHKNPYSAIEMLTLLPVYNKKLNKEFMEENGWVYDFLPNHPGIDNYDYLLKEPPHRTKKFFEAVFNILFPDQFNAFLMKFTDWKWRRKWRHSGYSPEEYNRAFQTEIHISKNHPVDYEKKVLQALKDKEHIKHSK